MMRFSLLLAVALSASTSLAQSNPSLAESKLAPLRAQPTTPFYGPERTITFRVPVKLKNLPPQALTFQVNCRPEGAANGAWSQATPLSDGGFDGVVTVQFKAPETAKNADYLSYTCLLRVDTANPSKALAMGWIAMPTAPGTTPVGTVSGPIPQPK